MSKTEKTSLNTPWHHSKRITLSRQKTAKLFHERGGCCHRCTRKLGPRGEKNWIVEHLLAIENGGTDAWENLGLSCLTCKREKDAEDHGKAAVSRRVATKHVLPSGMREPSQRRAGFRGWRKFDGTPVWKRDE